jgi:Zn-dependent protease with chaperone function
MNTQLTPQELEVLDAFGAPIEPVRVPVIYRVGLAVVAVAMVLLPLTYVALVALSAYGLYYHATANLTLFDEPGGKIGLLAYGAPLVAGAILVLFMIKPLFAPRGKQRRPVQLHREQQPLLYAFVERLCDTVGAPRPREIHVDCEVNASASLRRGFWSLFSNDLVLTIGLPLAAGLGLRQLAGVLAHEFGHFAQQAGMRLTYVIRMVSFWFARVVYERDAWDENLVRWSEGVDLRIGVIFYLARFFVWLTRKILWVLMVIGHALSCFLLRQMELDADRYEARLAGSGTFEETARALPLLAVASQGAQSDLSDFWAEARLADDLPTLIVANRAQIPAAICKKIDASVEEERTGVFDTHPCTKARIESARREQAPGVFRHDGPATLLFRDFPTVCRMATADFYEAVLGEEVSPDKLHPVGELLAQQEQRGEEWKALRRFHQGVVAAMRPLTIPPSSAEDAETLIELRAQLLQVAPRYRDALERHDKLDGRLTDLAGAEALMEAGFGIAGVFEFEAHTRAEVDELAAEARRGIEAEVALMEPAERVAGLRLGAALARLSDDPEAEVARLVPVYRHAVELVPRLPAVGLKQGALGMLLRQVEGNQGDEQLYSEIMRRSLALRQELDQVEAALDTELVYPFEHGEGDISLKRHLLEVVPPEQALGELLDAGSNFTSRLIDLYVRLLGKLSTAAERVEAELGLEPLPELPEEGPQEADTTN